jgi:hypothetical protein|tara:strand:- start:627 stop:782 length:156 start_codon:yes stop_codon:yes gene_type:complete
MGQMAISSGKINRRTEPESDISETRIRTLLKKKWKKQQDKRDKQDKWKAKL